MNSPRTVHDAARTDGLIKWVAAVAIVIGVVGAFIVWLNNLEYHPASAPVTQTETTSEVETLETTTVTSQSTTTTSSSNSTKVSPVPASTQKAQLVDTPSENISCELHDTYVGCSIRDRSYSSHGLEECNSELYSIALYDSSSSPSTVCGERYLGSPGDHVQRLDYGDQAQWVDFACKAQPTGMTCWQQSTGKGFVLNKAAHNSL